jgi:hypothetical protein
MKYIYSVVIGVRAEQNHTSTNVDSPKDLSQEFDVSDSDEEHFVTEQVVNARIEEW